MKKTNESLYIKVLLWIYEKGSSGFTKDELREAFEVSDQEWSWVRWTFLNGLSGDSPLAWHIGAEFTGGDQTNHEKFYITPAGSSTVLDYLELSEARKSSKEARWWAIIAVFISILVGLVQIYGTQGVKVSNFPNTQQIELKSGNLKTEVTNFPKIQPVWVNNPIK